MEFEEKKYLIYLLIIPVLLVIYIGYQIWQKRKQKSFAQHTLFKQLAPDTSKFKSGMKFAFFMLAIAFLILALANPRIGTKIETVKREGIDIVFAIDVSKSMLAEDVAPNRLEKSKQIVSQMINSLGADRVGIIAYAASAFPVLPITTDYASAKMFLQQMNTDMLSSQGTAISEAIVMSTTYFDQPETNKLLVLLSDGEDHEQGVEDAITLANEKGLKVLTIGVGTEAGGPIPVKLSGGLQTHLRDLNNDVVITKLNSMTLEDIASETSGSYILGNNSKKTTEHFKDVLNSIEKTQFEAQEISEFDSKFQWFLAIVFLLLVIDVFLLDRKTPWIKKLNLFNEKK